MTSSYICINWCFCQNENLVRVVTILIDNIATSLPNKGNLHSHQKIQNDLSDIASTYHDQRHAQWNQREVGGTTVRRTNVNWTKTKHHRTHFQHLNFVSHLSPTLISRYKCSNTKSGEILALEHNRYRMMLQLHYTTHTPCMEIHRIVTKHTGSTSRRWT